MERAHGAHPGSGAEWPCSSRRLVRGGRCGRALRVTLCALCISHGSVFASSQTSTFKFLQNPGPYPVGMKVVDQYDRSPAYSANARSRTTAGDGTRPLQTLIWYPSRKSPVRPMTVGDYVRLADTEMHFDAPDENENRWRTLLKTSLDIPLWAVQDAPVAK